MPRRTTPSHRILVLVLAVALIPTALLAPSVVAEEIGTLQWVESVPAETNLDLPDVPDTRMVWPLALRAAQHSIDVLAFYLSEDPDGPDALEPVLDELESATARGVRLRVLADRGFDTTYPEIARRLDALDNAYVRLLDARTLWGGVQHAKGFIVDGERFFVGSQNWDYRALVHIHELGALVESPELTRRLLTIYEMDWQHATAPDSGGGVTVREGITFPDDTAEEPPLPAVPLITTAGDTVLATLAASPPQALPSGVPWDEPLLVELLDSATELIRVQLLSYNPSDRDGGYYALLDDALRRADARGVKVEMVLANWAKRNYMLRYLQSLAVLPNVEVRFTNIPDWSGGFVPFARVDHAKFVTVDGERCWLGTANWSADYFSQSRNISLFLEGRGACDVPDRFFERSWSSVHTETVDPCGTYEPPRRR